MGQWRARLGPGTRPQVSGPGPKGTGPGHLQYLLQWSIPEPHCLLHMWLIDRRPAILVYFVVAVWRQTTLPRCSADVVHTPCTTSPLWPQHRVLPSAVALIGDRHKGHLPRSELGYRRPICHTCPSWCFLSPRTNARPTCGLGKHKSQIGPETRQTGRTEDMTRQEGRGRGVEVRGARCEARGATMEEGSQSPGAIELELGARDDVRWEAEQAQPRQHAATAL